ncbi:MAG: cytochrome C [Pseudolabrys sp.]|nr:cytochrome C [Pseudolabrys sp.]
MRNLSVARRLGTALLLSCLAGAPLAAETFTERVTPCLACHGDKGQSDAPEVPSLGGQPAPYLLIQLYLFREKQRVVEIMNDATATFTDDDLRRFSDFIAALPPPQPPSDGAGDARLERGRTLITQHRCNSCHGLDLAGRDSIPLIAAQREDYLVKSLREYKSNARPGYDPAMASVMAPVDDAQIRDLAFAIARFR